MSRISVGATLYTRTSSQDTRPPGEGQRTHTHQVRDRGHSPTRSRTEEGREEHWTAVTGPPDSPCPHSATPEHLARHPEVGPHPRGDPAQPVRRPGPAAHPPPGSQNCQGLRLPKRPSKKRALKAAGPQAGLQPTRGAQSTGEA